MSDVRLSVETLLAGFMRLVQSDNQCDVTGAECREKERCGCYLEMLNWCSEADPA
jgi:hypothetical protein